VETPHLEHPKCLPTSSQHLTVSTSLPLSTDLPEVHFIPRPRNKALAAVKNKKCIYIYVYVFFIFLIYIYISCKLLNYTNVHMISIIVSANHLEHQCFQIVQSLTLEPPSGEFPSTHRRIPVRHI
jgi:hypothetical protein